MTRTLLLLIMLLFAAPSFAQTKQSAPVANQQQLDSIAKAVQANIEKDLAIDKESRQSQCSQVENWITLFGLVITVMGIILPVVMFFMGKRIVADVNRQKADADKEFNILKDQIRRKQKVINKIHNEQLTKLEGQRTEIEHKFEVYNVEMTKMRNEMVQLLAEAKKYNKGIEENYDKSNTIVATMQSVSIKQEMKPIKNNNNKYSQDFLTEMQAALDSYDTGEYKESIELLLEVEKKYKEELTLDLLPDIYFVLAYAYGALKILDKSILYYEKVIENEPQNADAWNNLGYTYSNEGKYDIAIEKLNKAIELNSFLAGAWNNLGIAYSHKREYDTAIDKYNEAIRIKPDFAEAWNNIGTAYNEIREYDVAIEKYNKAIELDPDYADALYNRGIVYAAKGEYNNAIADYEEALRFKPDDASTLGNYAELQIVLNQEASKKLT